MIGVFFHHRSLDFSGAKQDDQRYLLHWSRASPPLIGESTGCCVHIWSTHLLYASWFNKSVFKCLFITDPVFPSFFPESIMWTNCGILIVLPVSVRNFTIRFMPIPIIDASQALKASPEKTEDALLKVEEFPLVPPLLSMSCYCVFIVFTMFCTYVQCYIALIYYHDCRSVHPPTPPDWELPLQEPRDQKVPTGTGLSASAGHCDVNHTTGVHAIWNTPTHCEMYIHHYWAEGRR